MTTPTLSPEQAQAVTYLAQHWPGRDTHSRHKATAALTGGLLRDGLKPDAAGRLIEALCEAVQDEESAKRVGLVAYTAEKLKNNAAFTGWPTLIKLLGADGATVVDRFKELLGIGTRLVATYDYCNEAGCLQFQTVRYFPKKFKQRRPDGAGGYVYHLNGTPRVLYRLPELQAADPAAPVFVVEGEKDVDRLRALGLVATTNPMGAGKWKDQYSNALRGRHVVVIADNDAIGRDHGDAVAGSLVGRAARIQVLTLPDLPEAGDVSDWLDAGGTAEELMQLVQEAPDWRGPAKAAGAPSRPPLRPLEPYRPFPLNCLPEPVRAYVEQGALALGCDPVYVVMPILAVLAGMIGNTRSVRLKRGWVEPCVVWTALLAASGTLKSPAYYLALAAVFRTQKRLRAKYQAAFKEYEQELAEYEAGKKEAKKNKTEPPEKPDEPVQRRIVCSDVTIEKLAEIHEDNPRGMLVVRDELAGLFGSFSRYKGKAGGSDLPNWLEMFRAGPVIVDRKTGDRTSLFIERAATSLTGGIQPRVFARALTAEFVESGLLARLLLAMPTEKPKRWSEAEVDEAVENGYETLLDNLQKLELESATPSTPPAPPPEADDLPKPELKSGTDKQPCVLNLSPEARAVWVRFYNAWALEQAAVEGELAAAYSKLEAYAARFALIHHVVTHVALDADDRRPIGTKSIEAGIQLCRWFAAEARRIYGTLTESNEEHETRRLVEYIAARRGRITVNQLQRSNSRRYPTTAVAEAGLQRLVDYGLADWQDRAAAERGGRPTRDCVLKSLPTTDDTDETPSPDLEDVVEPSDETTDETPAGGGIPRENEGFVGIVGSRYEPPASCNGVAHPNGFVGREGVSSVGFVGQSADGTGEAGPPPATGPAQIENPAAHSAPFRLVRSSDGLPAVLGAVRASSLVGIDTETTGLDPRSDRVRVLSVNTGPETYLIDCFAVDPRPLWPLLSDRTLVFHNASFDLAMLAALGFTPGAVRDTVLMSRLLHGTRKAKGFHGLAAVAERELGRKIDKTERQSDWTRQLSPEQIAYAAADAAVLLPLYQALNTKLRDAELSAVADIERRCLPAMVWLASSGVMVNKNAWHVLAVQAESQADRLAAEMNALAPPAVQPDLNGPGWNWDSPAQVKQAFAALGIQIEEADDATLARIQHPLAPLLRQYRSASRLATTYGSDWLKYVASDGRVHAKWNQLGADTGRMSSSRPNLQQIPRGTHRRCFTAPDGRALVKADYSQIELRIAAKVSGDEAMLEAYRRGLDLHTLTAQRVLGVREITEEQRQLAKAVNFGLLYGMGAGGFRDYAKRQYGLDLTEQQARTYRRAFFAAYPGLRAWHASMPESPVDTRTLAGRRRRAVEKFTEKLNTPVQGTGADGLKMALALLWERRAEVPGAFPVLVAHDEIVVECGEAETGDVRAWLIKAMTDGMTPWIDPVPVDVEVKIGATWGMT